MNIKYQNTQLYSECQLVSALNASYKLGKPIIKIDSKEYEKLVDMTCGRYGSCLGIDIAHRYLKIKPFDIKPDWDNVLKSLLYLEYPVQLSIWTLRTGYHSVCVVDYKHIGGVTYFKAPNLYRETNKQMYISKGRLQEIWSDISNLSPNHGVWLGFVKD